ncbi:MAG TPA: N-acetylmuramoyl-L-alanine amidase [Sphingomicrobium sp.]|nr:N-acetylmuramoyl-L-alanine amidase [Sphingomicrobium sp.]
MEHGTHRWWALALLLLAACGGSGDEAADDALLGEARRGGVTVALADPVRDVAISEARVPGRPIVLVDPGHGGADPGASGLSGAASEKVLTLAFARELRQRLVDGGRVRVALTRDADRSLSLAQRADIARRIGAALFISIHMDSAPNPLARGASVYSLSDVASDLDAARFARAENESGASLTSEESSSVRFLLSDLALRDQMAASAALAERLVSASRGRVLLRPEPHRFAAFHVLRRSEVPGVLFEAGYISNAEDEASLLTPAGRAPIVAALARAIEIESALIVAAR